jgi:hypothetical protein
MKLTKYEYRNSALRELGFSSYKEYLQSEYWQRIKTQVPLDDWVCLMCLGKAQVLHHVRYDPWTLIGERLEYLAPLCHACHEVIEIDDGKKTTMEQANVELFAAIYRNLKTNPIVKKWFHNYTHRPRFRGRRGGSSRKKAWQEKQEKERIENMPVAKPGSFYFKAAKKKTRKRHGLF